MASSLYPYQEKAVQFLEHRKGRAALFMEMGVGKTRVALSYCERQQFQKVLIVSPISVAAIWQEEVRKVGIDATVLNLTSGSIAERCQKINFYREDLAAYNDKPLYIILNYESYWRSPLKEAILRWQPDCVILDEAHRIKGRTTRQSKFAHTLGSRVDSRLALTGTPVTNGLQDLFSIYRFIDPYVFGTRWIDFETRYLKMGGFQGYSIVGYRNEEEAARKVRQTAFQISKAEALDLPERTDVTVPVPLSYSTQQKYDEFKIHAIAEIEGEGEDGLPKRGVVLARIVLSSILRLQQIANGFTVTEFGETILLSEEKIDTCRELVQDALEQGQQVVVFCRFLKDISRLAVRLPHSETIYGEVKEQERAARILRFREGKTKVLICQIQVASLGIDLTAASIAIFYSTGFSLTDFVQARDRLHRIGQRKPVTYYHLLASDTVDEKVMAALQAKTQIAAKIVDLDYSRQLLS